MGFDAKDGRQAVALPAIDAGPEWGPKTRWRHRDEGYPGRSGQFRTGPENPF